MGEIRPIDEFINVQLFENKDVKIEGSTKAWQMGVLLAISILDKSNSRGTFYKSPIAGWRENDIDYSKWNIYYEDESTAITDHVIKITDVCNVLSDYLTTLHINFERKDPDLYAMGDAWYLEESVEAYLEWLTDEGYLTSLNTRIGHWDEGSYKISDIN